MGQTSAFLERMVAAWVDWMTPMSWQVALLVVVLFGVALLARKASPRFRYFLWCLVLVKLCLPPSIAFVTGVGRWLPSAPAPRMEARVESLPPSAPPPAAVPIAPLYPAEESVVGTPPAPVEPPIQVASPAEESSLRISWQQVLLGVWLIGVLGIAGVVLSGYWRVRRKLSRCEPVEDPGILAAFHDARARLGIRGKKIRLLASPDLSSPILFGLLRPRIVIPSDALKKLPQEQLRPILLHELAHVRRRDLWVNWIQVILQTLYWFHPFVWFANMRLRREREMIVDDLVLAHLESGHETYGTSLLNVLKQAVGRRMFSPGYIGIIETRGSLVARLRRILDANRKLSIRLGWLSAALILALALILIPQARAKAKAVPEGEIEGLRMRIGTSKFRHADFVRTVAFSPDGKILASGGFDGDICLWDPRTGMRMRTLSGRGRAVEAMVFSPDGKRLYSGGRGHQGFHVWDVATGKHIAEFHGKGYGTPSLALSPDGKLVATGSSEGIVQLWEADSGKKLQKFKWHNSYVQSLAFSPDGRFLASAGREGARLWEVGSEKEALKLNTGRGRCESVAFSPDGKTLISGGHYLVSIGERRARSIGKLWFWDVATGTLLREVDSEEGAGEIRHIVFTPDRKTMVTASIFRAIQFWDPATGTLLRTFQAPQGNKASSVKLSFSPDGKMLAASGHGNSVMLWDLESGKQLHAESGEHDEHIRAVAYSPDGKTLASADFGGTVCLWDSANGGLLRKMPSREGSIVALAFSPDGRFLAAGGWQDARVHDLRKDEGGFALPAEGLATTSLTFSPDGKTVAVAYRSRDEMIPGQGSYVIRLFNLGSAKHTHELQGHSDRISSLSFSSDGKTLASASRDRTVRLWDTSTAEETGQFEVIGPPISYQLPDGWGGAASRSLTTLALPPVGEIAAAAYSLGRRDGRVGIHDLRSGRELREIRLPGRASQYVAFSGDGSLLATTCRVGPPGMEPYEKSIYVLDVATGKQVAEFNLTDVGRPSSLTFSPDGKTLVSGMADTTIIFWDLEKARLSPPVELAGPKETEDGQLFIYPQVNHRMGTAANRIFLDEAGVPTKAILYKPRDASAGPPFSEDMLTPYRVVLFTYDDSGRRTHTEQYTPEMKLIGTEELTYASGAKGRGTWESRIWRGPQGQVQEHSIFRGPGSRSMRYYDVTGKKLIAVRFVLPDDMDLAYGWGPVYDGLRCGIAPDRSAGQLDDIKIWVTVKNTSQEAKKVVRALQYKILQMELRDKKGKLVSQDKERIAERSEELKFEPGAEEHPITIQAGLAEIFAEGYRLSDWYQNLPPGRYTVTIRRRTDGQDFPLVSNSISIVIEQGIEGKDVNKMPTDTSASAQPDTPKTVAD